MDPTNKPKTVTYTIQFDTNFATLETKFHAFFMGTIHLTVPCEKYIPNVSRLSLRVKSDGLSQKNCAKAFASISWINIYRDIRIVPIIAR